MKAWSVKLVGYEKWFTFITDQCKTPEEVEAAMEEKFCMKAESVEQI